MQIGDFADMESLSSYDTGKKSFEGRRYKADIEAAKTGMELLLKPLRDYNRSRKRTKHGPYVPEMHLTLGNHEQRIPIAVEKDAKLDGLLSISDLGYEGFGWKVHPFLQPVVIDGVAYCHYFTTGQMGRPCTTAQMILNKHHMSAFAGHQQGRSIWHGHRADGQEMTAIIAGSFYLHDEAYLTPQTNRHWRGIYVLNEVEDGYFDEIAVSMRYLKRRFG